MGGETKARIPSVLQQFCRKPNLLPLNLHPDFFPPKSGFPWQYLFVNVLPSFEQTEYSMSAF